MNFFKSVFADSPPNSPPSSPPHLKSPAASASESESGSGGVGWSFGDMIQTLSSKSESVLETYRRDLQEFSTGLKAETLTLKHVAATSLDVGAAKAQVSLESVGLAIDSISSAVSDIIFHPDTDTDTETTQQQPAPPPRDVKYSRFESQLRGIQTDESTYTDDPVDELEKVEFGKWKLGFVFGDYEPEAEELLGRKDGGVEVFYDRLVVNGGVDRLDFWLRYFYRVHRLKQAEFVRARLVNRAIVEDEEELSWDVDDDDNNNNNNNNNNKDNDGNVDGNTDDGKVSGEEEKVSVEEAEKREEDEIVEVEEKVEVEGKGEVSECSKDSDISIVSSQVSSHGEEDMGWDEIEDIGSEDDDNGDNHGKKGKGTSQLGSPGRDELRKRLSVAEDDEDLSWDIEDDDEPIKS